MKLVVKFVSTYVNDILKGSYAMLVHECKNVFDSNVTKDRLTWNLFRSKHHFSNIKILNGKVLHLIDL